MERGGTITWVLAANDTDFERTADRVERRSDTLGRNVDRNINRGTTKANKGLDGFRTELAKTASVVRNFQVATRGFNMTSIVLASIAAGGAVTELASALVAASGAAIAFPGIIASFLGVMGTLKTAIYGLDDAFKAVLKDDPEKLAEALEKLSPAAREVVGAFKDINEAFKPIRLAVQDAVFDGLGEQMRTVAKLYLPILKEGMVDVGKAMNGLAKEAASVVKEPFFQGMIKDSLKATAEATTTLSGAVRPLAESLAGLVKVGLPYTNMLAKWVVEQSKLFAAYAQSKKGQDELTAAVNTGITALQTLGDLVGSTLGLLITIFETSSQAGVSLIATLTGIIDQMNGWLKSTEGQKEFVSLMQLTNEVITTLATVVGGVLSVMFDLIDAFNGLPGPVKSAIITALAFVAVLTPIVTYLTAVGGSLEFVRDTFTKLVPAALGITVLLGGLAFALGGTSTAALQFQEIFKSIPKLIENFMNALPGAIAQFTTFITAIIDQILKGLPILLDVGVKIIMALVNGILSALPVFIKSISTIITSLVNALVQAIPMVFNAALQLVQGILNALIANLPAIVNATIQAVQSIIDAIIKSIPLVITATITFIQAVIKAIIDSLPKLIDAGVKMIDAIIKGIADAIPAIIDGIVKLIPELIKTIIALIPQLIDAGTKIIIGLLDGITRSLPTLIQGAIDIMNSLIQGLITLIPILIPAAVQIIMGLVNAIIANLPLLIQGAIQLVTGLVTGIIQALPQIIEAIVQLITIILDTIVQNLPLIIESAITLITTLAQALIDNLPLIVDAIVKLTLAILNAIIDNLPTIIEGALQIILTLVDALIQNFPKIVEAIYKLIMTIVSTIGSLLGSIVLAGLKMMIQFGVGLVQAIPNLLGSIGQIIGSLIIEIGNSVSKFIVAGVNLVGGLIKGIVDSKIDVINKIKDIAAGALDTIKKFFGIHSPSRVMAQMGDFMMQGLQKGIESAGQAVIASSAKVADGVASAFSAPLDAQNFSSTANVNTDVADIGGITRSVGNDVVNGSSNDNTTSASGVIINQTNNVNTDLDMDQVNRDLAWELNKI